MVGEFSVLLNLEVHDRVHKMSSSDAISRKLNLVYAHLFYSLNIYCSVLFGSLREEHRLRLLRTGC